MKTKLLVSLRKNTRLFVRKTFDILYWAACHIFRCDIFCQREMRSCAFCHLLFWFYMIPFSVMISFFKICIFGFQFSVSSFWFSFCANQTHLGSLVLAEEFFFQTHIFCLTSAEQVSAQFHKCGQRIKNTFFVSCRIYFNSSIFGNDAILAALLICCVKGEEKWIWRCVDWCCLLYWWRCGRVTLSEAHISFFVGGRAPSQKK